MAPGIADQKCKGDCGLLVRRDGFCLSLVPTEHYYRDNYCRACYINKLEQENERLKAQIAHHKHGGI